MKADYVHKDTLTATDYVELNKNNELLMSYNQELLKENQKYKEVINKAIEFINECMRDEDDDTDIDIVTSLLAYEVDELLDILKGVER